MYAHIEFSNEFVTQRELKIKLASISFEEAIIETQAIIVGIGIVGGSSKILSITSSRPKGEIVNIGDL
jgi:hypothetical protein